MRLIIICFLFMISCRKEVSLSLNKNLVMKTEQIHKKKPKKKIKLFKRICYFYQKKSQL